MFWVLITFHNTRAARVATLRAKTRLEVPDDSTANAHIRRLRVLVARKRGVA